MELYRLQSFKEYLEKELKETNKSISDHSIKHFDINDTAFVWNKYQPVKVKITDVYFDGKYYSYNYEEENIPFFDRMKEKLSYYYWHFFNNKEPYLPDIKFGCGSYVNAGEGLYKTEQQATTSIILTNLIYAIDDYLTIKGE